MKLLLFLFIFLPVLLVTPKAFAAEIGTGGVASEEVGCRTVINGFEGVPTIGCFAEVLVNGVLWAYGFSLIAGVGYFAFGAIQYMFSQDDKGIKAARDRMIWAVLGFVFIIVSFLLVRVGFLLLGLPDITKSFSFFIPQSS